MNGTLLLRFLFIFVLLVYTFWAAPRARAELDEESLAELVIPPFKLGSRDSALPVWKLLDGAGAHAGYIFESVELAPIPGYSGIPVNLLVSIDLEGRFLEVQVLGQNEPVFVSGLGTKPLHEFVRQYQGKSLASSIKVRIAQDKKIRYASSNIYIDGIAKATASVRIVNQSTLAAALKVARKNLKGVVPRPARRPRTDIFEKLDWSELVHRGLVKNIRVTNGEVEAMFAGTTFAKEDPHALSDPNGLYLDLWIADLGIPTVGHNLLTAVGMEEIGRQVALFEEPILLLANGRHRLVTEDFIRNSMPDRMVVLQRGFPVNIRDADAEIELFDDVPMFDQVMVLRIDTRLGFNPGEEWDFIVKVIRKVGAFQPQIGIRDLILQHELPIEFFEAEKERSLTDVIPWMISWQDQKWTLGSLAFFLLVLSIGLSERVNVLRQFATLRPIRLLVLAIVLGFIGWFAQAQLSIVTVLAVFRAVIDGRSLSFLLYDPVSLLLWVYVIITLYIWGRGTFCGWLCPFGALQELLHTVGKTIGLVQASIPTKLEAWLMRIKYFILTILVFAVIISTKLADALVEVEPFKTVITLAFERVWPFVFYAGVLLVLNLFVFKAFCRFICPLGAALALPTRFFRFSWIKRRAECGTPCKLCKARCGYGAIKSSGEVDYTSCFQCMECLAIHDDKTVCVPLVLAGRNK
jgi:NosR/NirI family transcriptional regulator, nitrous oxide reductase regulator